MSDKWQYLWDRLHDHLSDRCTDEEISEDKMEDILDGAQQTDYLGLKSLCDEYGVDLDDLDDF